MKNKLHLKNKGIVKNLIWLCCGILGLYLSSCQNNVIYHQYTHTPLIGWERNDTLSFSVSPLKQSGTYLLDVGLRINGAYPFTKLTLVVEQKIMPQAYVLVDTIICNLRDPHGNILGKGISYYQYEFNASTLNLKKGDSLHVIVKHGMKREILPGVSDVGIKLRTR